MYARIIRLFPGKDLFEILEILFGAIGGKILIALFTWYPIHLGALVLRNFSEFTQISAMPETPQLPMMILMVLTTIYLARHNMKGVGKWSTVALFFIVLWLCLPP
jgi:spore germination protein KB